MSPPSPVRRRKTPLERVLTSPLRELLALALIVGTLGVLRVVIHHGDGHHGTPSGRAGSSSSSADGSSDQPQPVHHAGPPIQRSHLTCVPQTKKAAISVVTYNIKSGRFGGYSRLAAISEELKKVNPDVVLLQEVDKNRVISGRVDEPTVLADSLGYQYSFGLNVLRPGDSQYGTAILSRFPILATQNVHLPNRPGLQQRGLLRISIEVHGIAMNIYDTHLQNTSRSMRDEQISAVLKVLAEDSLPKIIGGDLNDVPASSVLQRAYSALTDTWSQVGVGAGHTVPAGAPRARIDYLLYGQATNPDTLITPLAAKVLGVGSSDHRAVEARYRITAQAKPVCVPSS